MPAQKARVPVPVNTTARTPGVGVGVDDRGPEGVDQRRRERVAGLGPVQPHDRHRAAPLADELGAVVEGHDR
jgi:hypothetical protein